MATGTLLSSFARPPGVKTRDEKRPSADRAGAYPPAIFRQIIITGS